MRYAPSLPTTERLEDQHPVSHAALEATMEQRRQISDVLETGEGYLSLIGPCAMTAAGLIIAREAGRARRLNDASPTHRVVYRSPFWKPRSDPDEPFWGLETVNPELAYATAVTQAEVGYAAAEIARPDHQPNLHLRRYGKLLVFGWTGSRNIELPDTPDDESLMHLVAAHDPTLPIGVKNGLDGDLDTALRSVDKINQTRQRRFGEGAAPAVLIYRGGKNATNPDTWEEQVLRVHELTGGRAVIDYAHMSEMAHSAEFGKSPDAQLASLEHGIALAESGYAFVGGMAEASDAESPTDPVISFDEGLDRMQRLHDARMGVLMATHS